MSLDSLKDVLEDQIKDLYSAETQLIAALPKVAEKANNAELKQLVTDHLAQTKAHAERLERVGELIGVKLGGKTCKAMKGLVEEAKEGLAEKGDPAALDVAIVAAAQRVEHYEISAYGTAIAIADQLGHTEVSEILEETLTEEKAADEKLTRVCMDQLFADAPEGQVS